MNSKFNKFETLFETAFSHYSNGGFREGTPVVIKPSFLKSKYFKTHYSGDEMFVNFLNHIIKEEIMFFIRRVVGHGPGQNTKDANDNPLSVEYGYCLYKDSQIITIKEMPENAPAG